MSEVGSQIRLTLTRPAFALKVDLRLPARGITVLHGPSGCGKTTLLRCVAGLERGMHDSLVRVGDELWQDDSQGIFVSPWRRALGYVFQEASLFDHLDVRGNLEYGRRRAGAGGPEILLEDVIDLLGIEHLLGRRTQQLSGGERQRVAMARALGSQPRVLLLDEPMASLDSARRQELLPWLERLRDQLRIPMLYVTHSAAEAARLADTLIVMSEGSVVAAGPVAETLAGAAVPIVLGEDAGALLEGTVEERDLRWQLARIGFPGGSVWVRDNGHAAGRRVRVRILARDVSIALDKPAGTSIQNLLPCTIRALQADAHPSQLLVRMACTADPRSVLLARITARAAHMLALAPGMSVWAQVKSAALVE